MRDIRDYKAKIRPDAETLGSASLFNVITEAVTLRSFTAEEVRALYRQHTDETGTRHAPRFADGADEGVACQVRCRAGDAGRDAEL